MKPSCRTLDGFPRKHGPERGPSRSITQQENIKIQTKRVICTQKKPDLSAAHVLERGSCKQVAMLKQYSWISDDNHRSLFTTWRGVLLLPNNTNQAGSTNYLRCFSNPTFGPVPLTTVQTHQEQCMQRKKMFCFSAFLSEKTSLNYNFVITYLVSYDKIPLFFKCILNVPNI